MITAIGEREVLGLAVGDSEEEPSCRSTSALAPKTAVLVDSVRPSALYITIDNGASSRSRAAVTSREPAPRRIEARRLEGAPGDSAVVAEARLAALAKPVETRRRRQDDRDYKSD